MSELICTTDGRRRQGARSAGQRIERWQPTDEEMREMFAELEERRAPLTGTSWGAPEGERWDGFETMMGRAA